MEKAGNVKSTNNAISKMRIFDKALNESLSQ